MIRAAAAGRYAWAHSATATAPTTTEARPDATASSARLAPASRLLTTRIALCEYRSAAQPPSSAPTGIATPMASSTSGSWAGENPFSLRNSTTNAAKNDPTRFTNTPRTRTFTGRGAPSTSRRTGCGGVVTARPGACR